MKFLRQIGRSLFLFCLLSLLLVAFSSAKRQKNYKKRLLPLTSVHIIDRNGFSESITNKDRLTQYLSVDFLKPQPYQKVLRIYARDGKGDVRSVVTSYHENGNPKQFLEILNGRAMGQYREWHENGIMSVSAKVLNGTPDITSGAEKTWVFDDSSLVWDVDGNWIAEISYSQGLLEGNSNYFHSSGRVWKVVPYRNNEVDGTVEIYKDNQELLQQITYNHGVKDGDSYRYWTSDQVASHEFFRSGKLECGEYYDKCGKLISEIKQGAGYRALFGKESVCEMQKYLEGILDGDVQVYNSLGQLKRTYNVHNNIKDGEEIEYYAEPAEDGTLKPKLSFFWHEGKIHGLARTWYPNGNLESQREMANNEKNGILTAWYRDGNLLLIEEYEKNKLIRGDYFRIGEKIPVSQIAQGKGIATIFDSNGHFLHKIVYENGKPSE